VAKEGQKFFFEKKNQKTFIRLGEHRILRIERRTGVIV